VRGKTPDAGLIRGWGIDSMEPSDDRVQPALDQVIASLESR
jgi:hypothetical protein